MVQPAWNSIETWISIGAFIAVLIQAVYGVIAFVFTLTQTTNINSYNYTVTYTAIQGVFLALLLLGSLIWWNTLSRYRARMWSFLSWFIFTYTVIVVWLWHYRHHNNTDNTPTGLTEPFTSYLCANIFIVFASAFFIVLGWGIVMMQPDVTGVAKRMESLSHGMGSARIAFLVIGIIMFISAILEGIWGWLFVTGYSFGPLYVPLTFFCLFSVLNIVQFFIFVYFNFQRASAVGVAPQTTGQGAGGVVAGNTEILAQMFSRHWDELWAVELFLAMFWVINFGFWVNLWQINGVQYTQWPHFNSSDMPLEYWSVFSNSVFNAIFAPLLVNYFVTFWCYNSDIVEVDQSGKSNFRVDLGTGSFSLYGFQKGIFQVSEPGQRTQPYQVDVPDMAKRWGLFFFFATFIVYQLIAGGFIINELLQSTYLATHYYVWFIFADAYLTFAVIVFIIYGLTTYYNLYVIRYTNSEEAVSARNAVNVCTYGRPILTLIFIAFMTMFTYSTIYKRYHDNSKHIADTQNPLVEVNSQYYGSLLSILGYLFISVFFVAKDGMMSINNVTMAYTGKDVRYVPEGAELTESQTLGKHHTPKKPVVPSSFSEM